MRQTSTAKLPAFFSRLGSEEGVVRVNKSKVTSEKILMEIILGLKATMDQLKT